jgi:putative Mg2+ transporter-C (MgtC) family protein
MVVSIAAAALNLGAAVGFGALIGSERQLRRRMAGLRTNALVSLGAASFVLFAATFDDEVSPTRVAAQIVSGIGFLGAGIIFRDGFTISGLNTAATLWCSAAVGMLAGHGELELSALVTAFVVFVNFGMRPVVRLLKQLSAGGAAGERGYVVSASCRAEQEAAVRSLLVQTFALAGIHLAELATDELDQNDRLVVEATILGTGATQAALEQIVGRLSLDPSILSVRWRVADTL